MTPNSSTLCPTSSSASTALSKASTTSASSLAAPPSLSVSSSSSPRPVEYSAAATSPANAAVSSTARSLNSERSCFTTSTALATSRLTVDATSEILPRAAASAPHTASGMSFSSPSSSLSSKDPSGPAFGDAARATSPSVQWSSCVVVLAFDEVFDEDPARRVVVPRSSSDSESESRIRPPTASAALRKKSIRARAVGRGLVCRASGCGEGRPRRRLGSFLGPQRHGRDFRPRISIYHRAGGHARPYHPRGVARWACRRTRRSRRHSGTMRPGGEVYNRRHVPLGAVERA